MLEERTLLDATLLGRAEVANVLDGKSITGVTILSHGLSYADTGGDALHRLAEAIQQRLDDPSTEQREAWLLDYDILGESLTGGFDTAAIADHGGGPLPAASEMTGHVVLLFDWAPESQEITPGWAEAAGDALFNLYVGLNLPIGPDAAPSHFIGRWAF
jgi:hypothetical protein